MATTDPQGGAPLKHLNCPRCGLTVTPKASWLTVRHCPRCVARARLAVVMFASTLPSDELYARGALPATGIRDPAPPQGPSG